MWRTRADVINLILLSVCCVILGYVVEVCHIPCPLDCKLSDWSTWSGCSVSCGSGLQMRSKWLREKAFNGGRPCPRLDLKNQVSCAVARLRLQHVGSHNIRLFVMSLSLHYFIQQPRTSQAFISLYSLRTIHIQLQNRVLRRHKHSWPAHPSTLFPSDLFICFQGNR